MAYDLYASAGLAPQDLTVLLTPHIAYAGPATGTAPPDTGALVGQQDGFTVLAVTQTQMTDAAGNLVDAMDITFRLDAHPGVFTYSAPADFYGWSSPLAGVAALAQTIEAIYAIGSGSPPPSSSTPSAPPSPFPWAPMSPFPSAPTSPEPPPRTFTPL